jgi:hypothetical protein
MTASLVAWIVAVEAKPTPDSSPSLSVEEVVSLLDVLGVLVALGSLLGVGQVRVELAPERDADVVVDDVAAWGVLIEAQLLIIVIVAIDVGVYFGLVLLLLLQLLLDDLIDHGKHVFLGGEGDIGWGMGAV